MGGKFAYYPLKPRAAYNLTKEDVTTIRERYHNGDTCITLARHYHVSYRTIERITRHLG